MNDDNEDGTCGRALGKRCAKTHPRMSFTNDAKGGSLRSLKPFSVKNAKKNKKHKRPWRRTVEA